MDKATIQRIGIIDPIDGMPKFWIMSGGPGYEVNPENGVVKLGGYAADELKQVADARDILSDLSAVETPVTITIPAGHYWSTAFFEKFDMPVFHKEDNITES